MNYYCFLSPIGYALLQDESITWNKFQGSPDEVASTYFQIVNNNAYDDIKKILPKEGLVQIDNKPLFEYLEEELADSDIQVKYVPLTFDIVERIDKLLTKEELETSDYISKLIASVTVQNQKETRDVYIAQAIASLDDMTKTINLVSNRIREWYGLHFPELGEFIEDPAQLFRLIRVIGNKETYDWTDLGVSENKEERLKELSEGSLGAAINIEDLKPIQDLAKLGLDLINTRREIEEYIENTVFVIMPNVTRLIGPLVSARLLAQAGSLRNLSKMASSTVQLLGAETALFRHLKTGERPPKHGYLFQSPLIHQAPFHQRGKIARIIAGKISIAARLDHFLGEEQPGLVEDLNKRLEYVSTHFQKAPAREKRPESKPYGDRDRKPKRKFGDKDRKKFDDRSKRGFGSKGRDGGRGRSGDRSRDGGRDRGSKGRDRNSDKGRDRSGDKGRDRGSDKRSSDRGGKSHGDGDRKPKRNFGDKDRGQKSDKKFKDRGSKDKKRGDSDKRSFKKKNRSYE